MAALNQDTPLERGPILGSLWGGFLSRRLRFTAVESTNTTTGLARGHSPFCGQLVSRLPSRRERLRAEREQTRPGDERLPPAGRGPKIFGRGTVKSEERSQPISRLPYPPLPLFFLPSPFPDKRSPFEYPSCRGAPRGGHPHSWSLGKPSRGLSLNILLLSLPVPPSYNLLEICT